LSFELGHEASMASATSSPCRPHSAFIDSWLPDHEI
jgi:hypothetical protein